MNITIIGGSGFIGSRLCQRLQNTGIDFTIIDKNPSHFFSNRVSIADIRDYDSLYKAIQPCDAVINLAAEHRDDVSPRSLYDEVNVKGSENIVKVCSEKGIQHIVFTSSVAVYGFAPPNTGEDGAINYFNDYGRTKWEAEQVYKTWYKADTNNRNLTIIRPTVVFGERNRGNVYNLLKQIASGLFPMVGNGKNIKSMAYVENVAAFIEYMLTHHKGMQIYNYIDKPDFTMNDLVCLVRETMGGKPTTGFHWPYWLGYIGGLFFDAIAWLLHKKLPISSIRVKKFCATTQFNTRIFKDTDFSPPVSLKDGLMRTIQFEFVNKKDPNEVLFYSE